MTIINHALLLLMLWGLGWQLSSAQIALDGTLGSDGPLAGPDYVVPAEVGQLTGGNLFHSFGEFNIQTGETATFTGPATVDNIVGRVTGGSESILDGLLRSTIPGANFYLVNPAGVVFGPNARLDVQGSFYVSTADYLSLEDGGRFDVSRPEQSMLTVAPVSAFGFLAEAPAGVTVDGGVLQTTPGETLALVGGDLRVDQGALYAPGGEIDLVSVASAGEVRPNGNGLELHGFARLGTIDLLDARPLQQRAAANIDVSGEGKGAVFIRGGQLLADGALLRADTLGATNGRGIDIAITGNVTLRNVARISADTHGLGRGGDLQIAAGELLIDAVSRISSSSSGTAEGSGSAGDVRIQADRVVIRDAPAGIIAVSVGPGDSGSIEVLADELVLEGRALVAGVGTTAFGSGDAGSIRIQVERLAMRGATTINAITNGPGQGGSIAITADSIALQERVLLELEDGIAFEVVPIIGTSSEGEMTGAGNAGDIVITASLLRLDDSFITGSSANSGGGEVTINGGSVQLVGGSAIRASAGGDAPGGNVTFNVDSLVALEGSDIKARAEQGLGGNITFNAAVFLRSADVELDVSSDQIGNEGTIADNSPELDISGSLVALAGDFVDVSSLLRYGCAARTAQTSSSLIETLVLPADPAESVLFSRHWQTEPSQAAVSQGSAADEFVAIPALAQLPLTGSGCRW